MGQIDRKFKSRSRRAFRPWLVPFQGAGKGGGSVKLQSGLKPQINARET
jgi:hypothetical protein